MCEEKFYYFSDNQMRSYLNEDMMDFFKYDKFDLQNIELTFSKR